ncbi:MAG: GNAT family N-acetyltransferase [Chitinophagales bacterium]|jgi:RimJ/RimL family protein N-acetyltransferase|nr:GNAT family N-acetyltransferase [Chitinophagales bacterium]
MPYFRPATGTDVLQYFEWANEASTRQQSYSSQTIPYSDHLRWFEQKLASPNTKMYVLCEDQTNVAVGQIRFELQADNTYAIVGYAIGEAHRGKGYGRFILGEGILFFVQKWQKTITIVGFVKNSNKASQRLFLQLGFVAMSTTDYPDSIRFEKLYGV